MCVEGEGAMSDQDQLPEIKRRWGVAVPVADIAHADVDWLVGEVERLRGLLGRLEWVEQGYNCVGYDEICPVCNAEKDTPHVSGCWLAEVLGRNDEDAPPPK
jgi:hypothetical protein